MKLRPRSEIPEQVFPALAGPDSATLLAMLYQLDDSQWWAPEVLRARQLQQLGPLIRHAAETVPGYRKLYRGVPVDGEPGEVLARLPLLERPALQKGDTAWRTTHYPKAHGHVVPATTSGSTGMPVRVLHSDVHRILWHAITLRNEVWQERDLSAKVAIIRHLPDVAGARPPRGQRQSGWGASLDMVCATGPAVLLDLSATVRQQAAFLVREQPDYLLTFPTSLDALARHFLERGGGPRLRQVSTVGETLTDATRALCREAFGAEIADVYSTVEVGYVALQCPAGEGYHVQAESVLVEVLDADERPCAPGEVGRVVLTSLTNRATPLIRYAVGDYAEVGEPCACGRGLPVLRRILGRARNMLVRPDGEMRWPYIESRRCLAAAPYRQMQLIQVAAGAIEVHIVPAEPLTDAHRAALTRELHRSLGWPFELRFVEVDAIPRGRGGKFEEFVCRLEEGGAR